MATNISKLDTYWDDFLDNFIRALLADGYDEFDILEKIMDTFKNIRNEKKYVEEPTIVIKSDSKVDDEVPPERRVRNTKPKSSFRINTSHNYKNMAEKFNGAVVYIRYNKEASMAEIIPGPNGKIQYMYRVLKTGKVYNESEYLEAYNIYTNDTSCGLSYLNKARIVFEENPLVSISLIKRYYDKFNSIEDVRGYEPKPHKGKRSTK